MISIIIPAFNEAKYIKNTLSTLKGCIGDYEDVEVIVVNNGSQDKTLECVQQFSWVKIIDLPSSVTIAEARNIGVSHSSGQCLSFIDADILVTDDWFIALVNHYQNNLGVLIISGFKVSISKYPSWVELNWFSCFKKTNSDYINSGNLVCSKKIYDLVGGFDSKLRTGEDVDFCYRAIAKGVQVHPDEKYKVYHEGYPKNFKSFFMREKWHGIGDLQSLSKFFQSKVAIMSFTVFTLTVLLLFALLFQFYSLVLLLFGIIVLVNAFSFFVRFRVISFSQFFVCFFLNYIYFIARFFSIFEIFKNGNRNR